MRWPGLTSERPADGAYIAPQVWLSAAAEHAGSWWTPWQRWLAQHSGARIRPLPMRGHESGRATALADAPGHYVHGV